MIDLDKMHEKESFELVSPTLLTWTTVEPVFQRLGFTLEDDFAEVLRCDHPSPWQSSAIATCEFTSRSQVVYPDEDVFDVIRFSILVATLPEEHVRSAIHLLFLLASELSLPVRHNGAMLTQGEALERAMVWSAEIVAEAGDVSGSEAVGILIQIEYDRRRGRKKA